MGLDKAPTVLVLASGRGERFRAAGGLGSKLQAPLGESTVLAHTLAAVTASGLPWHLEDAGHPGMGDSIAAAVRATQHADGWLILPGDLPLVSGDTLRRVAQALMAPARVVNAIDAADAVNGVRAVQPVHRGERGHPVAFAADCRDALLALHGERGAQGVLQALRDSGQALEIALDDAGIVTDVDTPEALAAAERLLQQRRT